jgi:hypothetical protein
MSKTMHSVNIKLYCNIKTYKILFSKYIKTICCFEVLFTEGFFNTSFLKFYKIWYHLMFTYLYEYYELSIIHQKVRVSSILL